MSTTISVPGAHGAPPLIFKIAGTSAGNYGTAFQNAVFQTDLTVNDLSTGSSQTATGAVLNQIFSGSGPDAFTLQFGGQNTFVDVGSSTTVTGSAMGGDTVLATGISTYDATGNGNLVTFLDGVNIYNGGTATGDTITGGAGYDTINTGTGSATVFSGSGSSFIVLNDATGGDIAVLGDGTAVVVADGLNDTVVAATNGQMIFGSSVAGGTLNVVIGDNATSSGPAGDTIVANASTTTVFDSVGGNTIYGGSGALTYIGTTPASGNVADTIVGGSGNTFIFGASGDDLTLSGDTSAGSVATLMAGSGNETLNAAGADGRVNFFGADDSSSSATFIGSTTGFNYFQSGGNASPGGTVVGGAESLTGGTGTNIFGITDGGTTAHITVFDFAAGNDSVNFLGETGDQVKVDLSAATVTSANGTSDLTVTLSDNTTVTFMGISSLTGHVVGQPGS